MRHNPVRSLVLTSIPPQYYCVDDDGKRNPCYCHPCDWDGWAPSKEQVINMTDKQLLNALIANRDEKNES